MQKYLHFKLLASFALALLTAEDCAAIHFGMNGSGQTIAVIDSGIAYDHPAFADRYVGGWDFAERDDDPYDDQSVKSGHGTRVAGVAVAAESGVAPGADIVSLRVFDDKGKTYFQWVEEALQWTIENRTAFEHPITAVNISLGTDWNAAAPPDWATLENEFEELESLGVFITTSAGNDFTQYGVPGLTYPASSPHVTAVMALDNNSSQLAGYSQRHANAIAAPGSQRRLPVPDHAGNQNGETDDWKSAGGTSVAAPYLAGASLLVREALEMSGIEKVTPSMIADHLKLTGESIFDEATQQSYAALNLEAALEALVDPTPGDFNRDGSVNAGDYTVWRDGLGAVYSQSDYQVWRTAYLSQPPALPGDFDRSGTVDAADYTIWRDGLGESYTQADYYLWKRNFGRAAGEVFIEGDFNRDGLVNTADYTVWRDGLGTLYSQGDYQLWRTNYGRDSASLSTITLGLFSVPEPVSLPLVLAIAWVNSLFIVRLKRS